MLPHAARPPMPPAPHAVQAYHPHHDVAPSERPAARPSKAERKGTPRNQKPSTRYVGCLVAAAIGFAFGAFYG